MSAPTPEEEAQALADWSEGKPVDALPHDVAEMDALVHHLMHPSSPERLALLMHRALPRPKASVRKLWVVRGGAIAAAIAAMVTIVWFAQQKEPPLTAPDTKLMALQTEAAKSGPSPALDQAMSDYRQKLMRTTALVAAKDDYARVDAALARNDYAEARATLTALAEQPPRALTKNEAALVTRDALGQLAAMELRAGDAAKAIAAASKGLAFGQSADAFTVNLLIARANAHRQLGNVKEEVADLDAAMDILEAMLDAVLDGK
ncbi:MAG: hypothetical protein IT381_02195 [Deltaproteobacteria bacterium]|nr:hypothetical protein [Deltaproteobacteria bacterium]